MITQELVSYIRGQFALGKSQEEVTKALLIEGAWKAEDIEEAFSAVANVPIGAPSITPLTSQEIKAVVSHKVSPVIAIVILLIVLSGGYFALLKYFPSLAVKIGVKKAITSHVAPPSSTAMPAAANPVPLP